MEDNDDPFALFADKFLCRVACPVRLPISATATSSTGTYAILEEVPIIAPHEKVLFHMDDDDFVDRGLVTVDVPNAPLAWPMGHPKDFKLVIGGCMRNVKRERRIGALEESAVSHLYGKINENPIPFISDETLHPQIENPINIVLPQWRTSCELPLQPHPIFVESHPENLLQQNVPTRPAFDYTLVPRESLRAPEHATGALGRHPVVSAPSTLIIDPLEYTRSVLTLNEPPMYHPPQASTLQNHSLGVFATDAVLGFSRWPHEGVEDSDHDSLAGSEDAGLEDPTGWDLPKDASDYMLSFLGLDKGGTSHLN